MKVLITGGCGFIGSEVLRVALEQGARAREELAQGWRGLTARFADAWRVRTAAPPAVAASAAAINRSIERCVTLAPEQYQWEYKRFRRQQDDSEFY